MAPWQKLDNIFFLFLLIAAAAITPTTPTIIIIIFLLFSHLLYGSLSPSPSSLLPLPLLPLFSPYCRNNPQAKFSSLARWEGGGIGNKSQWGEKKLDKANNNNHMTISGSQPVWVNGTPNLSEESPKSLCPGKKFFFLAPKCKSGDIKLKMVGHPCLM